MLDNVTPIARTTSQIKRKATLDVGIHALFTLFRSVFALSTVES